MKELDLVPKQCLLASENQDAVRMHQDLHVGFFFEYDKRRGTTEA